MGAAEVYARFQQCLGGDACDMWQGLATMQDEATWYHNLAEQIEVMTDMPTKNRQTIFWRYTKNLQNESEELDSSDESDQYLSTNIQKEGGAPEVPW